MITSARSRATRPDGSSALRVTIDTAAWFFLMWSHAFWMRRPIAVLSAVAAFFWVIAGVGHYI